MANPKAFISDPDYIAFLSQDLKERPKDDAGFYIPEKLSTHDRLRKRLVEDGGVVQYGDTDSFVISGLVAETVDETLKKEGLVEDDSGDVDSDSSIEFADPNEDFEEEFAEEDGDDKVEKEPEPEKVDATSESGFAKLFGKAPPTPVENGARSRIFLKKGMDDSAHLNFIKNVHATLVEKPHTAVRMGVEGFARDPQKRHFSLIPEAKAIFAKSFLLGMGGCLIFHGFVGEATSLFCYGFGKVIKGTDRKTKNVDRKAAGKSQSDFFEYEVDKLVLEKALQASSQVFLKTQLQEAMAESKLFTRFSAATKKPAEPKVAPKKSETKPPKKEAEVVLSREPKVGKNARRKAEKKSSE